MNRSHALRAGVMVCALTGLAACTSVEHRYAAAPSGSYGYASRSAYPPGYAAAAAGDTYCQEAVGAVRQSEAEAAYTGSSLAASRVSRTRSHAARNC